MAETADQIYARVQAGGDLPAPSVTEWDVFPWVVRDGEIAPKPLAPPAPEEPRSGEDGVDCNLCGTDLPGVIWQDESWRVKHLEQSGLPLVLILEPLEHYDLPDLDEHQAAEFGVLTVRLARIVESLPNIARCHAMRIGDGAEHLHMWFLARPKDLLSIRGSFSPDWDDILPPGPEEIWRADLTEVARKLATHGGEALV